MVSSQLKKCCAKQKIKLYSDRKEKYVVFFCAKFSCWSFTFSEMLCGNYFSFCDFRLDMRIAILKWISNLTWRLSSIHFISHVTLRWIMVNQLVFHIFILLAASRHQGSTYAWFMVKKTGKNSHFKKRAKYYEKCVNLRLVEKSRSLRFEFWVHFVIFFFMFLSKLFFFPFQLLHPLPQQPSSLLNMQNKWIQYICV